MGQFRKLFLLLGVVLVGSGVGAQDVSQPVQQLQDYCKRS